MVEDAFTQVGVYLIRVSDSLVNGLAFAAAVAASWRWARSIAVWFDMRVLKGYREREEVYLNGASAVITKIGFLTITFLILNGGSDGKVIMRWACVSNLRMDEQKIERISLRPSELKPKVTTC